MKAFFLASLCTVGLALHAQRPDRPFHAYLYNKEYQVYLRINFYEQDVTVSGHDLYGQLPGFLGKEHNAFCWPVTSCRIESDRKATMELINDFGSEDLTATLERQGDSLYVLRQVKGNTLKVPHEGKWRKLPKVLPLKRK